MPRSATNIFATIISYYVNIYLIYLYFFNDAHSCTDKVGPRGGSSCLIRLFKSSYPEGNFEGGQILDGSTNLSPLYPFLMNDLHVYIACGAQRIIILRQASSGAYIACGTTDNNTEANVQWCTSDKQTQANTHIHMRNLKIIPA